MPVLRTGEGLGGGRWLASTRAEGDLRPAAPGAADRQAALLDLPWTSARQVHGATVLEVGEPLGPLEVEADALVTAAEGVPLAMFGADCALVAMSSAEGPVGVAHAGWQGVSRGVIEACAAQLRELGASRIQATVSAMIHPECYEFSPQDLERLASSLGGEVRAVTSAGTLAFDLPTAVAGALRRAGVELAGAAGGCTACGGSWFSWRARREVERHAVVAWRST